MSTFGPFKSFAFNPFKGKRLLQVLMRPFQNLRAIFARQRSLPPSPADSANASTWTHAILNSSYDAFIAIDAQGQILEWNPQSELTFGWNRAEVIGSALQDTIIPPEHREAHKRGLQKYLETGEGPVLNTRIEFEALHRDGTRVPVELTIYPVRQGETVFFGSFLHDISERKKAQALQQTQFAVTNCLNEESTLDSAVPRLLEIICRGLKWCQGEFWIMDADPRSLMRSHVWRSQDASGAQLLEADHTPEARDRIWLDTNQALPSQAWVSGQALWSPLQLSDEASRLDSERSTTRSLSTFAFPIKIDASVIGVMSFFDHKATKPDPQSFEMMNDLSQRIAHFISRRRAEADLERAKAELERRVEDRTRALAFANEQLLAANRFKDDFLATVSHELRTPLNVIQGHSELLLSSDLNDEDWESADAIHRNAKAQGHIINDLLDISGIVSGKLQLEASPVSLSEVIRVTLDSIRVAADSKNIDVRVEIDSEVGSICGDANRLQQVLWNLLNNAVKFTPQGGSIIVGLRKAGEKAQIFVSDTGKGIEPSFLPYVFDQFRQEDPATTRHFGGLGLGLAIVKQLVEAHGGSVEVSSPGRDRGATFTITLPLRTQNVRLEQTSRATICL